MHIESLLDSWGQVGASLRRMSRLAHAFPVESSFVIQGRHCPSHEQIRCLCCSDVSKQLFVPFEQRVVDFCRRGRGHLLLKYLLWLRVARELLAYLSDFPVAVFAYVASLGMQVDSLLAKNLVLCLQNYAALEQKRGVAQRMALWAFVMHDWFPRRDWVPGNSLVLSKFVADVNDVVDARVLDGRMYNFLNFLMSLGGEIFKHLPWISLKTGIVRSRLQFFLNILFCRLIDRRDSKQDRAPENAALNLLGLLLALGAVWRILSNLKSYIALFLFFRLGPLKSRNL